MGTREALAVSVSDLCFTYLGSKRQVLQDVTLTVAPGKLTWLTGPNASGKSTLLKAISGVIPTVIEGKLTGQLAVGQRSAPSQNASSATLGDAARWNPSVGMVLQDANVYLFRTVYDEVAFPIENSGVQMEDVSDRVAAALGLVGIVHLQDRMMHTLSGGERQKVAIAAALSVHPEVLLLDEPFEQLDPSAAQGVLQLLRSLAAEGAAVVIATRDASRVGPDDAHITICSGQLDVSPPPCVVAERPQLCPGGLVLDCREVSHRFSTGGGISDVNLAVYQGEAVAVLGPNGAGKTTLMKHVIGLLRPDSGEVAVNGTDIATLKVHEVARQVGILFQNPDEQIFNRTVLAEVEWGLLARGVTRPDAEDRAFAVLDELGLSAMASTNPHELTASERQLVAFASVLVTNPQLIVLDEPTKALDDQAAEKLAAAIDRRLAQGAAVLLVTHDVRFADRIATRRVMLTDGQLATIPTE